MGSDTKRHDLRTLALHYWGFEGTADLVFAERRRQYEKFGLQEHDNGTSARYKTLADNARDDCENAARMGSLTWQHILNEEVWEAFAEEDPGKLRTELVQVMAVCAAWLQNLDGMPA